MVEPKILPAPATAKRRGQIKEYLDRSDLDVGYMLSFSFNKNKEPGLRSVQVAGKALFEETV